MTLTKIQKRRENKTYTIIMCNIREREREREIEFEWESTHVYFNWIPHTRNPCSTLLFNRPPSTIPPDVGTYIYLPYNHFLPTTRQIMSSFKLSLSQYFLQRLYSIPAPAPYSISFIVAIKELVQKIKEYNTFKGIYYKYVMILCMCVFFLYIFIVSFFLYMPEFDYRVHASIQKHVVTNKIYIIYIFVAN